jgi:RNA polymerase sigma-70 factor, ECF subfamily
MCKMQVRSRSDKSAYNRGVESAAEVRLARALIDGRADAFDEFVETFRTRIFQYSYLMCGQREDAEEVAQDTLLKVFENLDTLRDPERIRSWVFRIAKNECLMKRRRSVFAPDHELSLEKYLDGDGETNRHQIAGGGILPYDEVLQSQVNAVLKKAMQSLPPTYRSVILLRDMEELSTEETAEILDVSTDVVKQRLHRGRLTLKKLFEEQIAAREQHHA